MKKQTKTEGVKGVKSPSLPSFYPWQLINCRELDASPDVIHALLDEDKTYTLKEAADIVKQFMNRKA